MRAIVLSEIAPPETLRLCDSPDPEPRAGHAIVRLRSAALNHRDIWIRKGLYAGIKFPTILGSDGAGIVESVGDGVDATLVGREVIINPGLDWGADSRSPGPQFRILGMPDDGTYAERVRVPAGNLRLKPPHLSWDESAALPLAGLTAFRCLTTRGRIERGEWVLVTGIGGGVSTLALQLAVAMGARVIAASRGDEKLSRAQAMGAIAGVNINTEKWTRLAAEICDGVGPSLIVDSVGGAFFAQLIQLVKPGGRIVTYGATTGPCPQLEVTKVFWKQIDVLGSTMGNADEFNRMVQLVESSNLRPAIDSVFPLGDAAEAHKRLESGVAFGKVILRIDAESP
jgi:NADPH:quinone reductase-like Zn-dependent oxidoreductase